MFLIAYLAFVVSVFAETIIRYAWLKIHTVQNSPKATYTAAALSLILMLMMVIFMPVVLY